MFIFFSNQKKEIMAFKHGVETEHVYDYDITNNFHFPITLLQI